ncbi:5-(carboxyamino)imidazole ribonucleotide synthase [Halogeometricum sp. CBA1124]|uniref:5-(carboxyamino)imidazole ribonucleotide synthase n=1 Tax=Halogeometricum sp. CBA1124 TaxID=2668071 RepID=UPI001429CB55|nr:5-(carboxyamino)imidazole ribonucleotide synthase [Halogeometricum sp. CBA1124]
MTVTVPGPTLGVVGGGQLGRMLAEAAAPLGVEVVVLDPTPDCPAAPVARDHVVGDFDDPEAFRELAARTDALTFEIELADSDLLDEVADEYGLTVNPAPETLSLIEDKLVQKEALADAGVPVPPFRRVDDADDLRDALDEFGAVMLKARTGGYDGRGNVPVRDESEVEEALDASAARRWPRRSSTSRANCRSSRCRATAKCGRPVGENVHEAEILRETVVPARTTDAVRARADEVARDVLSVLDGRGVFGVELFETPDGDVSVNEIAPRPHNSGHWTIEGARTSQFEQHVRAVLGWPLGSTARRAPTAMANVLGTVEETRPATLGNVESVLAAEEASLHWYGKDDVRPLRKMGHLTLTGADGAADDEADVDGLLARARDLRDGLTFD